MKKNSCVHILCKNSHNLLQVFCDISKNEVTVIGENFEKGSVLGIKQSFNQYFVIKVGGDLSKRPKI